MAEVRSEILRVTRASCVPIRAHGAPGSYALFMSWHPDPESHPVVEIHRDK